MSAVDIALTAFSVGCLWVLAAMALVMHLYPDPEQAAEYLFPTMAMLAIVAGALFGAAWIIYQLLVAVAK